MQDVCKYLKSQATQETTDLYYVAKAAAALPGCKLTIPADTIQASGNTWVNKMSQWSIGVFFETFSDVEKNYGMPHFLRIVSCCISNIDFLILMHIHINHAILCNIAFSLFMVNNC